MSRFVLPFSALFCVLVSTTMSHGQIQWMNDLERAKTIAASEDKFVLLHFTGAHCRPCQHLETFVYPSVQLSQKMSQLVVPVKVKSETQEKIFRQFSVTTMPTDVVITPDGTVVVKRRSPKTVDNYLYMLNRLGKLKSKQSQVNQDQKSSAKVSLTDEVRQLQKRDEKIRQSIMANRKFRPNSNGQIYQPKNQTVRNEFVPDLKRFQVEIENPSVPKIQRPDHPFEMPNVHQLSDRQTVGRGSIGDNPLRPRTTPPQQQQKQTQQVNRQKSPGRQKVVGNPYMTNMAGNTNRSLQTQNRQPQLPPARSQANQNSVNRNPQKQLGGTVITNHFVTPQSKQGNTSIVQNRHTMPKITPIEPQAAPPAHKLAILGYCPVTLMTQMNWKKGDKQWGCLHRGRLFLFTSKEYRDQFLKTPDKYCPILAGYDPVIYEKTGKLVDEAKFGFTFMHDGKQKMVLFASQESKLAFDKQRGRYMEFINQMNRRTAQKQSAQKGKLR